MDDKDDLVVKKYLLAGPQTQVGSTVLTVADGFVKSDFSLIFEILSWFNKNIPQKGTETEIKNSLFRIRSAEEIISDKYSTGCTDSALALIVLCRAKGFPTKYVELLSRKWLEGNNGGIIIGHVVAEVYIQGGWYYVDPIYSSVSVKVPSGMVIYAKGLDSWDVGINHENWREKFLTFRTEWLVRKKNGG